MLHQDVGFDELSQHLSIKKFFHFDKLSERTLLSDPLF